MLKLYKFGSVVKLNHKIEKVEHAGFKVEWIKIMTPADVYYPATGAVVQRTIFYILVNENSNKK